MAFRRSGVGSEWTLTLAMLAVVAYLVLPPAFMVLYGSFQDGSPFQATAWTIRNYTDVLTSPAYHRSLLNTLIMAAGSTAIAVIGGTALAWVTTRVALPGMRFIQAGFVVPFLMSPFVGAIAWSYLAAPRFGMLNHMLDAIGLGAIALNVYSLAGMAWVSGLYGIPVVYLLMNNAFQGLDYQLEEAAEVTGAGRWRVLRTVVLPIVLPALLASALLEFVSAAESFAVPAVLGTPARIDVLATRIILDLQSVPANYGRASAAAVVLTSIAIIGLLGYQRALRQQRRFVTVTGKASRPAAKESGPWVYAGITIVVLYLVLAVFLPVIVLVLTSFQRYYGQPLFPIDLTWQNYIDVVRDGRFERALRNSLIVATIGSAICVAIGVLVAHVAARTTNPLRNVVDAIATIPIAFPGVVLGLALVWTYVRLPLPIYGTLLILILVAVTIRLPYATRFASARLLQLSPDLEEASQVTGAGKARTLGRIVLPLIAPSLAAAFLILFIITIREISTVVLLYGYGTEVLPILLLDLSTEGQFVDVAALTVLMLLLMFAVWGVASRFLRSPLQTVG